MVKPKPKRFVVEEVEGEGRWGWRVDVVDTSTGQRYYAGGGEPEDQTIGRDWSWVVPLLNQLASDD